jgi:uncharacterized protein YjbI with pentapeptide repeats
MCYHIVKVMATIGDFIRRLRSPEEKEVRRAIAELRVRGWLEDGSLGGVSLCHAHFRGADLLNADLSRVDLHQADLSWAELSMANLTGARLSRACLQRANLSRTNLRRADLFKSDLLGARNLVQDQLMLAKRLYGATMPDGGIYDGRYNLEGDLEFARWGRVDIQDPQAMADFFGVSLAVYLEGQSLVHRVK